jgi:alpha-tubulin suppressor-like RCC1 family protein
LRFFSFLILTGLPVALVVGACSSEGVVGALARNTDAGASEGGDPLDGGSDPAAPRTNGPLAVGGTSTCVRTSDDRTVRCWGDNFHGTLGLEDTVPQTSAEPVTPIGLESVVSLAAGERAYCALREGGAVYCWGELPVSFNSQPLDPLPVPSPFEIGGLGEVKALAVGRHFSCALETEGELRCWGLNDEGQLGIGSFERQDLPTTVDGFDGAITSITASMGGVFACATTAPGSVYCWGKVDGDRVKAPRKVDGLDDAGRAVEVVAGADHTCARFENGGVRCWGANDEGQLGDGTTTARSAPLAPLSLSDIIGLAAGRAHTCALRREGAVLCWGANDDGQVLDTNGPETKRPVIVDALGPSTPVAALGCGLAHTCVWAEDGHVRCWGSNTRSQLGPEEATF